MALRRNASNCSTRCFGVAAGVDLHGKTVTKYELALRASMVAADRTFARESLSAIKDHVVSGDSGMMYRFVALQGDATNANCWQKSKLHSTEVVCRYTPQPICSDEAPTTAAFDNHFKQSRFRAMNGYIQVVQDGTMGNTTSPTTTLHPIQNFCGVNDAVVLGDDDDVSADAIADKRRSSAKA